MLSCVQRIEKRASNQCADVYCSNHMAKVSLLMQNRNVFMCLHVFMCLLWKMGQMRHGAMLPMFFFLGGGCLAVKGR